MALAGAAHPARRRTWVWADLRTAGHGVGEETGTLDSQFARLSAEYSLRLQRLITNLSEVIKPVVVLLAGGMFVFLIVALLLPVYDLVKQAIASPQF